MAAIQLGKNMKYPTNIYHWIGNRETGNKDTKLIAKINPRNGQKIAKIIQGTNQEVKYAITKSLNAFSSWSQTSIISRANILRETAILVQKRKDEIAQIVHLETGKSLKDATNEVEGAIELGFFMAGEGRRYYGKTTTSAQENRWAYTIRQPVGVCALIVPFNTPIANVTWKAFPALLCGNTCVAKAASDTPYTPIWFGKILKEAGLPDGIYNVIQGSGEEIGGALLDDRRINLISFTGSVETGKYIQKKVANRLVKVSLELGGKNPLIVCDDANLEEAANQAILSAFSNAGQRCSSGSRIIVFEKIYEQFKKLFIEKTKTYKVGPVINEKQLNKMISIMDRVVKSGKVKLILGGNRKVDRPGYFLAPTILESKQKSEYDDEELFGPITSLYKVKNLDQALELTNNSPYGLTAAIHTASIHKEEYFINHARVGVVSVNGPTYGSEPHLPFGGLRNSGNGHREPGTEALDFYSEWKTVYIKHSPENI